jgi:hypothetical protein
VLNEFVYGMTKFQPSDGDELIEDEPPLTIEPEEPRGFDFSKISKGTAFFCLSELLPDLIPYTPDQELLRQIAGFIFDYIFNGKPRHVGSSNTDKLVEYGIARFGNLKDMNP